MTQTHTAPPPGSLYGVPGLTLLTEQPEANDGLVQPLAQANATNVQGIQRFNQTDVVYWWELEFSWTNTVTPGTSTVTTSPYFPFNVLQESRLRVQNQYDSWHVLSGIDAAIFQSYRPMRGADNGAGRVNLDANPAANWAAAAIPQANLQTQTGLTSGSAAINFTLELPGSLMLDAYFDMAPDGSVLSAPHRAIVSPQYMAGAARNVQPTLGLAAGSVGNLDSGPFNIGAGTGTYAGSITFGFRRVGVYSESDESVLPVVYAWQYLRDTTSLSLSGKARADLQVPTNGQILSLYVRLWDPAANGGLGAPINITNVTKCQVLFGSGLRRFDDTPKQAQRRFLRQHGFLPPQGVLVWDMATDEYGRTTNAYALNTYTTSGVTVHLEFSAALSATAYAVLGTEALTYVI